MFPERMRTLPPCSTLTGMDIEHEGEREYDQDTDGDYDENTLDGSEGLDADAISTDGEDLPVEPPESWKPIEENDDLDDKLAAERPDVGEIGQASAPGVESHDQIDELDPEGETRVLGED